MRCSEFVTAVAYAVKRGKKVQRTGPEHIARSADEHRVWSYCGKVFDPTTTALLSNVPWVEAGCRSCREAHLQEKRSRKPGWWARRLLASVSAR